MRLRVPLARNRWMLVAFIAFLLTPYAGNLPAGADKEKNVAKKPNASAKGRISRGKALFKANGCFDCHSVNGAGSTEGISLSSVGLRRNREFIVEQLADPEQHVNANKKAFNGEPNLMTNPNLSKEELNLIVDYLQSLKKPVPKQGQRSKDYNQL